MPTTPNTYTPPFHFTNQTAFYKGKVRDVYTIANKYLVVVASNRISAFDHVLPRPIPYKGQVLNQIAAYFLNATADIVPNWVIQVPTPNITIGYLCQPIRVEMVVRGYLAGHAWRTYQRGERTLCGVNLPEGLCENDKLPTPIITPTTKAVEGHDQDISKQEIISQNIVSPTDYQLLEQYTLALYQRGQEMAAQQGLILVDTKYEFGKYNDQIYLIDEIHTPDSSRYFIADGYETRQQQAQKQPQLSKEFVREWLMENHFQGRDGDTMPHMPDDFVNTISQRYIQLYEHVTGKKFEKNDTPTDPSELQNTIEAILDTLP
jgi:phosphoribosylaminoimidazole-succinocarboxamide synthase